MIKRKLLTLISRVSARLSRYSSDLASGRKPESVQVGKNSDFSVTRLRYKNGCRVSINDDSLVQGQIVFDRENAHVSIGNRVFMNGIPDFGRKDINRRRRPDLVGCDDSRP